MGCIASKKQQKIHNNSTTNKPEPLQIIQKSSLKKDSQLQKRSTLKNPSNPNKTAEPKRSFQVTWDQPQCIVDETQQKKLNVSKQDENKEDKSPVSSTSSKSQESQEMQQKKEVQNAVNQRKSKMAEMRKSMKTLNFKICNEEANAKDKLEEENQKGENINFIDENQFQELYKEKEILGEGSMGVVKKVICIDDNVQYAAKIVVCDDDEKQENIITEFKNMRKLDHPNIVKVSKLLIDKSICRIYIVMELVQCDEMFAVIQKLGHYSEANASEIFLQILKAIYYMHHQGCCHRDLKPHNILVSEDGKIVKITDFNVSKFVEPKNNKVYLPDVKMLTYTGTVAYTAPEVFELTHYDQSCDMWSIGVVLFTMLCGAEPFQAEYVADLIQKIKEANFSFEKQVWNSISDDAKDLVRNLLKREPKERLTSDQAIQHSWITKKQSNRKIVNDLTNQKSKLLTRFTAQKDLGLAKQIKKQTSVNPELMNELIIMKDNAPLINDCTIKTMGTGGRLALNRGSSNVLENRYILNEQQKHSVMMQQQDIIDEEDDIEREAESPRVKKQFPTPKGSTPNNDSCQQDGNFSIKMEKLNLIKTKEENNEEDK